MHAWVVLHHQSTVDVGRKVGIILLLPFYLLDGLQTLLIFAEVLST
jgi:hypothetical protein